MREELYHDILELATMAGKIMLENGGETYRAEQIITYFCRAYGVAECESYASPTAIMLSFEGGDGKTYTKLRRITALTTNLDRVDAVNSFSRGLGTNPPPIAETRAALEKIEARAPYPAWVMIAVSAAAVGIFTLMFGGSPLDCLCGLLSGALLRLMVMAASRIRLNDFFVNLAGGALAGILGWFFYQIGLGRDWRVITLSTLMLLVPGLRMTNALRDIASGDLVAGTSRGIEAIFIAVALACGSAISYMFIF